MNPMRMNDKPRCRFLGKKRDDVPHHNCRIPYECHADGTPHLVTLRMCRSCVHYESR